MATVIDFVWVQFYNNPQCNLNTPAFISSLAAWSQDLEGGNFVDVGNGNDGPKVYIGAPAFPAAGSGYVRPDTFEQILQGVSSISNLGGVMFWDGAYGEVSGPANTGTFMQVSKDVL